MIGGPLFGWCESCRRWRWTTRVEGQSARRRLRVHRVHDPAVELARKYRVLPRCSGSGRLVDADLVRQL